MATKKKSKKPVANPIPLKKTKVRGFKNQVIRFIQYPFADAYQIEHEPERDADGKIVYKFAYKRKVKGQPKEVKIHARTNKPLFSRDRDGRKIPKLTENPQYSEEDGQTEKKKIAQLPWGFEVKDTGYRATWKERGKKVKYAECRRRVKKGSFRRDTVWIREDKLHDERCLEVAFVDIGQGDGSFVVTPEDKRMVIDAGETDNMRRYLNYLHDTDHDTTFESAIISHPDADHYKGFRELFERPNFHFGTIYTNGLMEWADKKLPLGPKKKVKCEDGKTRSFVTKLVTSREELKKFLDTKTNWVGKTKAGKDSPKQFPSLIKDAHEGKKVQVRRPDFETIEEANAALKGKKDKNGKPLPLLEELKQGDEIVWVEKHKPGKESEKKTMDHFQMLSVEDKWLPGYKPRKVNGKEFSIEVLGPVTRKIGGRPALEWLSSTGKTKNGHSVVLLLTYGDVKILLGGDLNIPSEELLIKHHTGLDCPSDKASEEEIDHFLKKTREVFQVDVAKSCHHGSSDFTEWFLRALNPLATVISSGDNEPHSHPRSDTLGTIGRYSRTYPGAPSRPLIFSTELARSSKDTIKEPWKLKKKIRENFEKLYSEGAVDVLLEELVNQKAAAKSGAKQKKESKKALRERLAQNIQDGIEVTDDTLDEDVNRSVAVYGTITVVTDGKKVMIYQKLERKGSHGSYDIYSLLPGGKVNGEGPLQYKSKH